MDLNLLPKDVRVSRGARKTAKLLNRISITLFLFLLLTAVSGVLLTIYYQREINKAKLTNDSLRTEIASLESTEQELVLLVDRLGKIQSLISQREIENKLAIYKEVSDLLPENTSFSGVDMTFQADSSLTLRSSSSRSVQTLLSTIEARGLLPMAINHLVFNEVSGFEVNLDIQQ